jgi:hypothetical protein
MWWRGIQIENQKNILDPFSLELNKREEII